MFNIFTLAFVAVVVAIGLALLVTRDKRGIGWAALPEEGYDPARSIDIRLAFEMAEQICRENGLNIKERLSVSDHETYWIAESQNPVFSGNYVFGFLEVAGAHPIASLGSILEFKDFVKSVGSYKGFFFTNGFFTRDVHQPLEGARVALYNARKILEERERRGANDVN